MPYEVNIGGIYTRTIHVYLLTQFYQLHFRRHVSHGAHTVSQVFTADKPIFVFVKLFESIPQLCGTMRETLDSFFTYSI